METGLKNRVALISGASQGLGRATALAFAAEGTHLALCSRDITALNELAGELRRRFLVRVHTEAVDVRDTLAIDQFVANTIREFDRLDICVTNAGGPPAKPFLETTDREWDDAFHLNLSSAAATARAVIPHMQRARWGRIVMISSITAKQPLPQLVLSNAIRTGVAGLVRTLANEFSKDGILVNNIGPGFTATDRLQELSNRLASTGNRSRTEIEQAWVDQIPVGRLGRPEEVADTIVWLASERASFITGQTILVDGGMYRGL